MYSLSDNWLQDQLGFPIRKSPDHRLLASPRGLSQLTTSFIAYLRQGIHTHALSSLTIKFTLNTEYKKLEDRLSRPPSFSLRYRPPYNWLHGGLCNFVVARQYSVFKDRSIQRTEVKSRGNRQCCCPLASDPWPLFFLVGLGRVELPTSPLSGVRSSQLSYRPRLRQFFTGSQIWWSWSGSNRRPPECKSGALPAELQPPKNLSRPIGRKDRADQPRDHDN